MDRDETVRDLRQNLRGVKDEVRRAGTVPRALANPGAAARDFAKSALEAPAEEEPKPDEQKPEETKPEEREPGDG
jgi:hypothetical protein